MKEKEILSNCSRLQLRPGKLGRELLPNWIDKTVLLHRMPCPSFSVLLIIAEVIEQQQSQVAQMQDRLNVAEKDLRSIGAFQFSFVI